MVRRDFLKVTGLLSAALFVKFNGLSSLTTQLIEVECQGKLYRGTSDGKIFVSTNAGKSWNVLTNFGSAISIMSLFSDGQSRIHSILEFNHHTFELILAQNNKTWVTAHSPSIMRA